jgi:hypothetical protein
MSGAIPAWAVRGAKVVCVNDRPLPGSIWWDDAPQKGAIYTVERARVLATGEPVLYLSEIARSPATILEHGGETGYGIFRFRPVHSIDDPRADVALFKHHLDQHQPVDA